MKNNPYPGLASMTKGNWSFYGRNKDIEQLANLMIINRTVLFHSPSGAGKSSLISQGLIPKMKEISEFQVLPILRVNETLLVLKQYWENDPHTKDQPFDETKWNRFTWSVLRSLESENDTPIQSLTKLAGMSLREYLEEMPWLYTNKAPKLLIFDQFEEVLTKRWRDVSAKKAFFYQLGLALRNHSFWTLFVIREDYVAAIKPYLDLLPTSYPQEYRMELFEVRSARQAIEQPALERGVTYTPKASRKLLTLLSAYKRYNLDNEEQTYWGKWVIPLYLQLVCHRLWNDLDNNITEITDEHIPDSLHSLSKSLSYYYAQALDAIYENQLKEQKKARQFIKDKLINPQQKHRRQFALNLSSNDENDQLKIHLIKNLMEKSIIREVRENIGIYELAHDRLVEPILDDNSRWFNENTNLYAKYLKDMKRRKRQANFIKESWDYIQQMVDYLIEEDPNDQFRKHKEKAVIDIVKKTGIKVNNK